FPRAVFMSFGAFLSYHRYADHLALHSSPTRRSSDLGTRRRARQGPGTRDRVRRAVRPVEGPPPARGDAGAAGRVRGRPPAPRLTDRKSTRLNSSHVKSSYAVFCLKKKRPPAVDSTRR